jgi:hypothetical protein
MPVLDYGANFLTPGEVDGIQAQSWTDVYTPLVAIRTLLNTTGLDYTNVQSYGLLPSNIRTYGPVTHSYILVYNSTGGTLSAGTLVYINGMYNTGGVDVPTVAKAISANTSANTFYALGVVVSDITNSTTGTIAQTYQLDNLNTVGKVVHQRVYLDSTAGLWTYTMPTSPYRVQLVGHVTYVHASQGRIVFQLPGEKIPYSHGSEV